MKLFFGTLRTVSYTHLDVYKRQVFGCFFKDVDFQIITHFTHCIDTDVGEFFSY